MMQTKRSFIAIAAVMVLATTIVSAALPMVFAVTSCTGGAAGTPGVGGAAGHPGQAGAGGHAGTAHPGKPGTANPGKSMC
jgi:hypothetical protein